VQALPDGAGTVHLSCKRREGKGMKKWTKTKARRENTKKRMSRMRRGWSRKVSGARAVKGGREEWCA
jgi:hypothetical protein